MPLFLNTVQLAGNLTRDPELKEVAGNTLASFGLAINRKYKTKSGETKEECTFVDVTSWGRQAELVGQYLTKGRNCLIEGNLKLEQWEKDGQKRSKISVTANRVHFIGGQQEDSQNGSNESYAPPQAPRQPCQPQAPSEPIDSEPPF